MPRPHPLLHCCSQWSPPPPYHPTYQRLDQHSLRPHTRGTYECPWQADGCLAMLCGELPLPLVAGMPSACLLRAAVTQKAAHSPSISIASQLNHACSRAQASTKTKVCVCTSFYHVCVRKKGSMCVCVCVPCVTCGANLQLRQVAVWSMQAPRPPPGQCSCACSDTHAHAHTHTTISRLILTLHQVTLPR